MDIIYIILGSLGILTGAIASYFLITPKNKIIEETAKKDSERLRERAKEEADRTIEEAQQLVKKMRNKAQEEENQLRARFEKMQDQAENRLIRKEELLEQKSEKIDHVKEEYETQTRALEDKEKELETQIGEQQNRLSEIANLSPTEAKQELIAQIESQCENDLAEAMRRKLAAIRADAEKEGANIVVQAVQRYASGTSAEHAVTAVKVDSDEIKGKIIGREGRNIQAFENITGVDLIIDDTPGTITISSFDMFRRYVAKMALEELIKDGRIHPSRIEDAVNMAQSRADELLLELGQHACHELGITGFPEPILRLLGRLRFRTSYGQNVLQHSIEVAYIAAAMAEEIPGADPEICKKSGLVHDIGKAVSHEVEGGHAIIGMEILQKFGIAEPIIVAMKSHHEDFPYESTEARILQAADACSAARPGARRETMEKYLKRLKELESIAQSFDGVEKVYAIQAGRELRVFVNAAKVNDLEAEKKSFDIARKIEENCQYPGEVRVSVIRESRYEGLAK